MFGLFDDLYDDYYYTPRRQQQAPKRQQYTDSDLYDQLFGEYNLQREQPTVQQPTKRESAKPDMSRVPKSCKVTLNQEKKVKPAVFEKQKPEQVHTPTRKLSESNEEQISNRECVDAPEVAFKTYRPQNVLSSVAQVVRAKDAVSAQHLRLLPGKAVVALSAQEASHNTEIQVSGKGELIVLAGDAKLLYELPAYYERSEITAKRNESGIEITIPICEKTENDIVIVQIE